MAMQVLECARDLFVVTVLHSPRKQVCGQNPMNASANPLGTHGHYRPRLGTRRRWVASWSRARMRAASDLVTRRPRGVTV